MASVGTKKPKARSRSKLRVVDPTEGSTPRKKHRDIANDRELVEQAALAKFPPDGKPPYRSDREVARELGVSVQAVPALIRTAFDEEIIAPVYNLPHERAEVARLENKVRTTYGLQRVLLVPGLPGMCDKLGIEARRQVHSHVIRAMARKVAEYLDALLGAATREREQFMVGVAWGRTMSAIAEHLCLTPRSVSYPGLEVVPLVGITCESLRDSAEANVIAMRVAQAYGGQSSQLACPAFVPQEDVWIATRRLEQVRRTLQKLPKSDVVLTSMGPIPDDDNGAEEISICYDRTLNAELFKAARTWDAVGEICYWLFDENGEEVKTERTAIGLGFSGLQAIAADLSRKAILVAGGDRRRFVPLRAALRAHLTSVLVSDTITAKFLVGEIREP